MASSRTIIGSVVCVDLVGFSKRSVAQQASIKGTFNKLLAEVIRRVLPEERVILDTGDGVAITFFGDPESSLDVALRLLNVMNGEAVKLGAPDPESRPVRVAINLGPLKLAMDMNGHPNIIGDGISVAEKIVAFAEPGQVIASRSFHEAVSRISDENAKLFRYEGLRTGKDAREHEIYLIEGPVPERDLPPLERPAVDAAIPAPESKRWFATFLQDGTKFGAACAVFLVAIAGEAWLLMQKRTPPIAQPAPATVVVETPLRISLYSRVVDQQDTNGYFRSAVCPVPFADVSRLRPDKTDGPATAWERFPDSPWKSATKVSSGVYDNGQDCMTSGGCLRAEFNRDGKVLSIDTRTTPQPRRKVTVDFGSPWTDASKLSFATPISTEGLFEISGLNPMTAMVVCSSSACPEARQIAARFWFADPSDSKVRWRVDWGAVRVLRMSPKVWYVIADACGGSQYAELWKLAGDEANPVETSKGHFLVPLFFSAELK